MAIVVPASEKTCPVCDTTFARMAGTADTSWRRRVYCTHACASRVSGAWRQGREDWVAVGPLRDAVLAGVEAGRFSFSDVARGMGYHRPPRPGRRSPAGDTSRVKRLLGLRLDHGCRSVSRVVRYDLAVRLADVIGVDPHEVGL